MMKNKIGATAAEFATSKTVVWWDMDSCPLPSGYEPSRLGPRIDTALKNLGYNGPLTIIAIGNLDGIPIEFLQALASTGIVIRHGDCGVTSVVADFMDFEETLDQAPATVMLISDSIALEAATHELDFRNGVGYNFLLAYPPLCGPDDPHPSTVVVCGEWFWNRASLLKDSGSAEKSRPNKGSEEFLCRTCWVHVSSFEDFTEHLNSSNHVEKMARLTIGRELEFAQKEAEAMKKKKNKEARAMKKYKGKSLETKGEDLRRSERLSKAKKPKIEGEYTPHIGVPCL